MNKSMFLFVCLLSFVAVQAQVGDPVPDPIVQGGLSVEIEDVFQIPASSSSNPLARINILKTSKDNTGRHFVNDLRGKLYVIINAVPSVFLDLEAVRSNFVDSPGLGTGFGMFEFHPEFQSNGIFYTTHVCSGFITAYDPDRTQSSGLSMNGIMCR